MACFNRNIPLNIIELLLQSGVNPNQTFVFFVKEETSREVFILSELIGQISKPRFLKIEELFKKYGAVAEQFAYDQELYKNFYSTG